MQQCISISRLPRRVSIFAAVLFGIWVLFSGLTLLIPSGVLNILVHPGTSRQPVDPGQIPRRDGFAVPFEWIVGFA